MDTRRGAETEYSAKVRQAVYRLREITDRYFSSEAGQRWAWRAVIEQNEYRIKLERQPQEGDDAAAPPFIDSQFPGAEFGDEEEDQDI